VLCGFNLGFIGSTCTALPIPFGNRARYFSTSSAEIPHDWFAKAVTSVSSLYALYPVRKLEICACDSGLTLVHCSAQLEPFQSMKP